MFLIAAWLRESHAAKHFLHEEDYQLRDAEKERTLKCDLSTVIKRAGRGRAKILRGYSFFVTEGAKAGDVILTAGAHLNGAVGPVISAAGGTYV